MKRLLILLFLAITAVCANAQKELNVDSIIRVGIKKAFEPRDIKNHPYYPYLIFVDDNCFNNFKFDDEKTYCGLMRSSYFYKHYTFLEKFRDFFKFREKTFVNLIFTHDANFFDIHLSFVVWADRKTALFASRQKIRYIYSCETGKWEYYTTERYEF